MEKIMTVDFSHYRMGESFEFNKMAAEQFFKCNNEMFIPFAAKHRQKFEAFDNELKKPTFTVQSEQLSELDYFRDNAFAAICSSVEHGLRCSMEPRVEAARRLDSILRRYGNLKDLPYMQESGMITNLLQDLGTPQAAADLQLISAGLWFDDLQANNNKFIALFDTRNTEEAAVETGATRAARRAAEEAYKAAVQCINTLIALNGITSYAEIVNNLNNLIARQKTIIKTRTGKASPTPPKEGI